MLQGLAKTGLRVCRVGRPDKVQDQSEILTLDAQVRGAHPPLLVSGVHGACGMQSESNVVWCARRTRVLLHAPTLDVQTSREMGQIS